jgi:glycerol-3-phosphate cytidylyltransferase-like family protein
MVDGGFDPLHAGHIAYFRAAAALKAPVFCNVAANAYVSEKHPPLLPLEQRLVVLDAIRYLDYVYASTTATSDVLRRLQPRYYVKGDDWRGRLPAEEVDICTALGVEVVFVDTVRDSSTRIVRQWMEAVMREVR